MENMHFIGTVETTEAYLAKMSGDEAFAKRMAEPLHERAEESIVEIENEELPYNPMLGGVQALFREADAS